MYALEKQTNDLTLSDEQVMLIESARSFCEQKSPVSTVRELMQSDTGFDPEVWQEMADLGWPGIAIPEEFGGSGLGIGSVVGVVECMGRRLLTAPLISSTLAAQLILRSGVGSAAPQLLNIAEGMVATPALYESADTGAGILCELSPSGSAYRLSGEKLFVNDVAAAQLFVVSAQLDGELRLVLIDAEKLSADAIRPHRLIDETRRAARVDFSGAEISAAEILPITKQALHEVELLGALLIAAESTGAAASCLDAIVDYLKTRQQFGRYIGSYQALKHPAVDILEGIEAARSLVFHAATIVGTGGLSVDAEIACRMAKAKANDVLLYAGDRAVQFHGGFGFTWDCDAQLYNRRGQWALQQFGDSRYHRKQLARLLL